MSLGKHTPCLLLVDDQPINIQTLYRVLGHDHQVLMATSGAKALELCEESHPDMILLDLVMPDMDGWEVNRRLKASPRTAQIPVIVVTAKDDPELEARALTEGAVDFISKPINPTVVRARVATHLDLARSKSLLSAALDATADDILVVDPDGHLLSCNERFVQHWDMPQEWLKSEQPVPMLSFMGSRMKDSADLQPLLDAAGRTGDEFLATVELKNGRVLQRHLMVLKTNGRHTGHVFSFKDVTERVQAERALAELNANLESKVRSRTEALTRASKLAASANQAKSEFLSNMSHEMRTPMNSILGMSYLALRASPSPSPKVRDYLERINDSGQHLLGLINNILDFAKIESGRLALETVDFLVTDVVGDVYNQLSEQARGKGLRLITDVDPALLHSVRGDPLRLRQILLNYVGNAIKFSQQGDVVVRARCVQQDATGVEVTFEVEDQGIGLSDTQVGELFQAFHQADASTTRRFGGTGLGLAICKKLADLMGGRVGVRSVIGQGSLFFLTAPFLWGEQAAPAAAPDSDWEADLGQILKDKTILVADDNPLNQRVAVELLAAAGAKTLLADDGQQVLDRLNESPVDCVLMDVQMPVLDGLGAAQRIRSEGRFKKLPIIAMTANARPEDERACLDAGMNDFVSKPVIPKVFFSTLSKWLKMQEVPEWTPPAPHLQEAAKPTTPSFLGDDEVLTDLSLDFALEASEPQEATLVDLSVLNNLTRRNPKMIREISSVFLTFMDRTLVEMDTALANADRAALASLGHKAKSSAAAVGAMPLSKLCSQLEQEMQGDRAAASSGESLIAQIRQMMGPIAEVFKQVD